MKNADRSAEGTMSGFDGLSVSSGLRDWGQSVLPGSVLAVWSRDIADASNDAELQKIQLPEELIGSHPRRELSFRAGRLCAALALRQFGWAGDTAVGRDPQGVPLWPHSGILGSITHTVQTNGENQIVIAAALVAAGKNLAGIGIDCEGMMTERRSQTVSSQLALESEYRLLDALLATGSSSSQFVTLLFSAKESVFKAVYPVVRRMFGFKSYALFRGSTETNKQHGWLEFMAVDGAEAGPSTAGDDEPRIKVVRVHFRLEHELCWTLCAVS